MTSTHVPPITEEDIANFLTNTPGFFERHAEVLASVQITSPHGQRAVSLQERQAEMLREKIKGLEHRIMDMVRNSNDNTAIATKVHQWTSALLRVKDPFDLPEAVVSGIRTLFDVPQAAVRVWTVAGPYIDADFTQGARAAGQRFARAALEHAQAHMAAAHHLHEAGVHPLRKAHMPLHQRAPNSHGGGVHVFYQLHSMRVAHGYHCYQNSSWLRR